MRELCSLSLAIVVVFMLAPGPMSGCTRSDAGGDMTDTTGGQGASRAARYPVVVLAPPGHERAAVTVEVVRTPEQIQRGLMYRRSLPAEHGMLFLMDEERIHSFWMRNTYIPLDMIFIGKDMRVAGVVANATPLTDDSRRVDKPSYYVLEVNAGWAAKHHIGAGTPVRFKNVDR